MKWKHIKENTLNKYNMTWKYIIEILSQAALPFILFSGCVVRILTINKGQMILTLWHSILTQLRNPVFSALSQRCFDEGPETNPCDTLSCRALVRPCLYRKADTETSVVCPLKLYWRVDRCVIYF